MRIVRNRALLSVYISLPAICLMRLTSVIRRVIHRTAGTVETCTTIFFRLGSNNNTTTADLRSRLLLWYRRYVQDRTIESTGAFCSLKTTTFHFGNPGMHCKISIFFFCTLVLCETRDARGWLAGALGLQRSLYRGLR